MFKPMYVTTDDFYNYWGENLKEKLRSPEQADSFLYRVEDRLMNWIDSNTFRNIRYCELTPYQLDQFRKAILTQAMYVLRNGDFGMDSGYDQERGIVVKRSDLIYLEVSQDTINYLKNAGLFNLNIINRRRHIGYMGGNR